MSYDPAYDDYRRAEEQLESPPPDPHDDWRPEAEVEPEEEEPCDAP